MVALAVLMPIVASMGGNAGTQTMTVAVRALATKELNPANIPRVVLRETAVGLINGLAFAFIMALIAVAWFGTQQLGLVIAAAMVVNMLAAALAGIFIPLVLDRLGFDPAVASTVFVTTVTDVVGFFRSSDWRRCGCGEEIMSVESKVNIRPLRSPTARRGRL
ncbi:MAG: magnesium transporter, partial [Hyphomicrobium sp.]